MSRPEPLSAEQREWLPRGS